MPLLLSQGSQVPSEPSESSGRALPLELVQPPQQCEHLPLRQHSSALGARMDQDTRCKAQHEQVAGMRGTALLWALVENAPSRHPWPAGQALSPCCPS